MVLVIAVEDQLSCIVDQRSVMILRSRQASAVAVWVGEKVL